jgi:RimJ/RimL family protein N-acetyltransferase
VGWSLKPSTDGIVTLRQLRDGDASILIAGRDDEFHRFMGSGSDDPRPTAVIEVDEGDGPEVVGWVDHDDHHAHAWLTPNQCNVGYHVFAEHRGRGYATRAVRLLLDHLAAPAPCTDAYTEATFLIDAENVPSLRVAAAVGAVERDRPVNAEGRRQVFLVVPVMPVRIDP